MRTQQDLSRVTDAEIEAAKAGIASDNEAIKVKNAEKDLAHKEMIRLAKLVYGEGSREVRYIANRRPAHLWLKSVDDFQRRVEAARAEAAKKEREAKQAEETARVQILAVDFLRERGKVLGVDFEATDAIRTATDIAAQEAIAKEIAAVKATGEMIEFNGQNCDDCPGWDGEERRCECGNRRVSWDWHGDFRDICVYGEAY